MPLALQLAQVAQNTNFVHDYGPSSLAFLGLVLNGLILLKAALIASGRRAADVESIQVWTRNHEGESRQRDQAIVELKEIAASSKATAEGMERRLRMLEDGKHGGSHGRN